MTHCCNTSPLEPPDARSRPIAGSARLTTEPSRNATNEASTATATSGRSVPVSAGIRLADASLFGFGVADRRIRLHVVTGPGVRMHGALGRPDGQIGDEGGHRRQRPAHRDPGDTEPTGLVGVVQ